jgi:hypothetical protein
MARKSNPAIAAASDSTMRNVAGPKTMSGRDISRRRMCWSPSPLRGAHWARGGRARPKISVAVREQSDITAYITKDLFEGYSSASAPCLTGILPDLREQHDCPRWPPNARGRPPVRVHRGAGGFLCRGAAFAACPSEDASFGYALWTKLNAGRYPAEC